MKNQKPRTYANKTEYYLSQKGKYTQRAKQIKIRHWIANNWIQLLSLLMAAIGTIFALLQLLKE